MNEIKKETWIRTGILAFALVNQVLAILGRPPLPVSNEELYQALSIALTLMASIAGFWKNNSFTQNAIKADAYKDELELNQMEGN